MDEQVKMEELVSQLAQHPSFQNAVAGAMLEQRNLPQSHLTQSQVAHQTTVSNPTTELPRMPVLVNAASGSMASGTHQSTLTPPSQQLPTVAGQQWPLRSSASSRPLSSATSAVAEIRNLFPSVGGRHAQASNLFRTPSRHCPPMKRSASSSKEPKKHFKSVQRTTPSFCRTLILLQDPEQKSTLSGESKVQAFEKGYAISAVEMKRDWTALDVKSFIRTVFHKKLPTEIDFEIMQPMWRRLVQPTLMEGATLDGDRIYSLFHQKELYIRPLQALPEDDTDVNTDEFENNKDKELELISHVPNEVASVNQGMLALSENPPTTMPVQERLPVDEVLLDDMLPTDVDDDDDEKQFVADIETACIRSLEDLPMKSVKDVIERLRRQHFVSTKTTTFNINRSKVFEGCMRAMKRKSFNPWHKVDACFADTDDNGRSQTEGAVDNGGPCRELWRIVQQEIRDGHLFLGPDNSKNLNFSVGACKDRLYFYAGLSIGMAVIHGGPAPRFFSDKLYSRLIGEEITVNMDDILDEEIKTCLKAIQEAEDLDTAATAVANASTLLSLCGVPQYVTSMEMKAQIVEQATAFVVITRTNEAFNQLLEGLQLIGLLDAIKAHPVIFKDIFCTTSDSRLTAEQVKRLFVVNHSIQGSNNRIKENDIISFWRDYIIDSEDGSAEASLHDILAFATGADSVPPLGFEDVPFIEFMHDEASKYPKANTCSCTLKLPMVHNNYDDFKNHMDYGIKNGMVFAFA